jgi:hypothetical protein
LHILTRFEILFQASIQNIDGVSKIKGQELERAQKKKAPENCPQNPTGGGWKSNTSVFLVIRGSFHFFGKNQLRRRIIPIQTLVS